MDRALGTLGRLIVGVVFAVLVIAAWLTWTTPDTASPWLDQPWLPRWRVGARNSGLPQDLAVGLLAAALAISWWRATRPGPDGRPGRWGAKRTELPRATDDPLVALLGGAARPPPVDVSGMDPEAGGDHVERWKPEDDPEAPR